MRAWTLMTAMPPTRGHLALIKFAEQLADTAEVIICTQPGEPYAFERVDALRQATRGMRVNIHHLHKTIQQEPMSEDDTDFWEMWRMIFTDHGLEGADIIVASEHYGADLARVTGCTFLPYDLDRTLVPTKATEVRADPAANLTQVIREFQPHLVRRVTVFGAESVGKTTTARHLADELNGHFVFEYARPYLENPYVGTEVTAEKMRNIWAGQKALQNADYYDKPYIFQDTDLFSTVGYWDFWNPGTTPDDLVRDAIAGQSDLYLVLPSNIPFEKDPLRYGETVRETPDTYWVDLCQRYSLPYTLIEASGLDTRLVESRDAVESMYRDSVTKTLSYERTGTEYGTANG